MSTLSSPPASPTAGLHPLLDQRQDAHTLAEIAALFGVALSTIHKWLKDGCRGQRLPSFRIGARRYVRRADAAAFLDSLQGDGEDRGHA